MPRQNRLLSLLLCGGLLFSLCSPPVFAQAQGGGQVPGASDGPAAGCICTGRCAEGAIRADCPVCGADPAACEGPKAAEGAVSPEGVQAMIDALPSGEEITGDNAEEIRARLEAIDAAKARLSDEEIGRLDISRYRAAAAALAGLAANALPAASGVLLIGGREIPDTDADIFLDGTAAYDKSTHTLTLNNCQLPDAEVTFSGDPDAALTIRLNGEKNALLNISVQGGGLNISGPGSLEVGDNTPKAPSGIYGGTGKIVISGGAAVTAFSNGSEGGSGIYTSATLEIIGSTVNASGYNGGLNIDKGILITGGSKVTAASDNTHGIYTNEGNVVISGSEVTAASATHCGIWPPAGSLQIDSSTVDAKGYFPGLNGGAGVTITGGSEVTASSSNDCGIFSPTGIEISGSTVTALIDKAAAIFTNGSLTISGGKVTAHGYYPGLRGDAGIRIQNGSEVEAVSSNDCGIYSPADIAISGSKVTAASTLPDGGKGIFTRGDLAVDASEVYAQGSLLGIDIGNAGTANGAWIRAENGIKVGGGNDYQPVDSVTIQSGDGWVAGDARIPAGALVKEGDQIRIPQDASLYLEAGETKILGEANGITVDGAGALLLPAGTVIQKKDDTRQVIGAGGGKISLDGKVSTTYAVTLHLGGGTIAGGKEITEYDYGTGALLPAAGDMAYAGFRFGGWYADAGFSGSQVTAITPTDWGDKDYYAKWERETTPITPGDTVRYIIEHYKGGAGGYTLAETEYAAGKIGTTVSAAPKSYAGYTYNAGKSTASGELKAITGAGDIVTLKLYYDAVLYSVSVSASPAEGGSVSGGGSYPPGTQVSVQAAPSDGWKFLRWEENGQAASSSNPYAFPVEENRQLTAVFEKEPEPSADKESKTEMDSLSEVPEGLKDTPFDTVERITGELRSKLALQSGYVQDNFAAYDVQLLIRLNGGEWQAATEEDFPAEGIPVTLPYPQGTGRDTHDFAVTHMFTLTSHRLGTTAGETEQPPVEKTEEGLKVTFHGLSPVGIAWKAIGQGEEPGGITTTGGGSDDSPQEEVEDAYSFWQRAKRQIEGAKKDATIRINAREYRRMPLSVMKALRDREDVSLVIRWDGGEPITIPAGKAPFEEKRAYYPLSYLASYDFALSAAGDAGYPDKENPGTGASDRLAG